MTRPADAEVVPMMHCGRDEIHAPHDSCPGEINVVIETPEEAMEATSATSGQAQAPAGEERKGGTLKGGMDAAEMARRRWAKVRERETDESQQAAHEAKGQVVIVRTSVEVGEIVKALAKGAKKGSVQEARELRAYLAEFPVEHDTDVSALDRRTRQSLLAMLIDDRVLRAYEDGSLSTFLDHRDALLDEREQGDAQQQTPPPPQARDSGLE